MQNLISAGLLVLAFAVCSEAICCGRGKHGFCSDCSKVAGVFSSGQKCCGAGSGKGYGCNAFCCNCKACRTGVPSITHASGWFLSSKYTCTKLTTVAGDNSLNELSETKETFKTLDKDNDNSLSPNEFLEGLHRHLNMDFESSYVMATDLLNDEDGDRAMDLLDAIQNDEEFGNKETFDIIRAARAEFDSMDSNNDGIIQASEFDKDLE